MSLTPTTRSRTLLFLSYRDSTTRTSHSHFHDNNNDNDEHQHLIQHNHISLDLSLPPKWVDISDQVHDILSPTQQKISLLERLHAKHVLPGFADRSAEERDIEALTTDITRDFRRCQSLIQSIPAASAAASAHSFPPPTQTQSHHEKLAAQNVQRALAAELQEMSATFRKKQRVYLETLQGHAIKNQDLLIASGAVTLKGSEGMSEVDEDMRVASQNQSSSSHYLQEQAEQDIDATLLSRTHEISEIAKSISALAELFKDLQSLVIDQGTLLDSVEYNIEQTSHEMTEAVQELKVAERYQKNTGRRKCILLLLLICFGLVVVLIFKPRRNDARTSPLPPPTVTDTGTSHEETESNLEELPPIPIDVTTFDPEGIGLEARSNSSSASDSARSGTSTSSDSDSGSDSGTRPPSRSLILARRVDKSLASFTKSLPETLPPVAQDRDRTHQNRQTQTQTLTQTQAESLLYTDTDLISRLGPGPRRSPSRTRGRGRGRRQDFG